MVCLRGLRINVFAPIYIVGDVNAMELELTTILCHWCRMGQILYIASWSQKLSLSSWWHLKKGLLAWQRVNQLPISFLYSVPPFTSFDHPQRSLLQTHRCGRIWPYARECKAGVVADWECILAVLQCSKLLWRRCHFSLLIVGCGS